jgi:hypothetical protein
VTKDQVPQVEATTMPFKATFVVPPTADSNISLAHASFSIDPASPMTDNKCEFLSIFQLAQHGTADIMYAIFKMHGSLTYTEPQSFHSDTLFSNIANDT